MAEICMDFCPRIKALEGMAGSYKPETAFGHHAGSAAVQAAWQEQRAGACMDALGCDGPVVIGSEERVVRDSFRHFFRKRTITVPQYACGLSSELPPANG